MIANPPAAAPVVVSATASSLQRLDDKEATGMTVTEAAKARWLTPVEVLQFLDRARSDNYALYPWCTAPPVEKQPRSGTILLYDSAKTPNYREDGIEWMNEYRKGRWRSIERVLAREDGGQSDSDSQAPESVSGDSSGLSLSGDPTSALVSGARAEYLTSRARNTFHRREYRGPDNVVLLHYLDSVKALRMTNELADKLVLLSADAGTQDLPPVVGSSADPTTPSMKATANTPGLGDTMNILMEMVEEHDAPGTAVAEAMDDHVLKAATEAAYGAVVKHMAPEEAEGLLDAMEVAVEDALPNDIMAMGDDDDEDGEAEDLATAFDVTAVDIDEAIDQVLSNKADEVEQRGGESVSSASSNKRAAEIIEETIGGTLEKVLPDDLQAKLVGTTEKMLDAAGISLDAAKGKKKNEGRAPVPGVAVASPPSMQPEAKLNKPLPEIINITPDFHTQGYQPAVLGPHSANTGWDPNKMHDHFMVISTKTPIPSLPPYVDQYYAWERLAAFVDFQDVADDPLVRNISFNKMISLTPYSYQVKMPADIPNYSVRHVIVVGILLPKDHRVKRKWPGIELALKLTLQTEWFAGWDLEGWESAPEIKGVRRPVFMAPCGGTRIQLLTQISRMKFTNYPSSLLPPILATAMPPEAEPNFVQRVAITAAAKASTDIPIEKAIEAKRKRENYIEEFVATSGIDSRMSTKEIDKHRKVRFVERISSAIDNKGEMDESLLDGVKVEKLQEDQVDDILARVLMRYVNICIERCTSKEELLGEFNWSGYAGLSLLHHACFYNFVALVTSLINNGADTNILSAEGDLTPLHFAAGAGHREVVNILIQHGCNPFALDINGETPADHARKGGHTEVAALLGAYCEQAGIMAREDSNEFMDTGKPSNTSDVLLQAAFKNLSLRDKLGLNLFVDRSKTDLPSTMVTDATAVADSALKNPNAFSFISEEDRARIREAMSLASEMDLQEMNTRAEHQDVRRYLRQSNFEAINAASQALDKANKKEADALKRASQITDDPSKLELSRALAMLVLRKNLAQED